jgi:hypothetical protein
MKDMRSFLKDTYTNFDEMFKGTTDFTKGLEKVLTRFPDMNTIIDHIGKALTKGGMEDSFYNDLLKVFKTFGANMVAPGVGTIAPTSTGGTGGADYDKNNQILTYMKEKETTKINNTEFKLNIDVIHKMMDATGVVKSTGRVDRINLTSEDNKFAQQVTIGGPN